ncbi:MAG: type III secretion system chaperone [Pseudomonadota bacterium]
MIISYDSVATLLVALGRKFDLTAVSQYDEDQSWLIEVGEDLEIIVTYREDEAALRLEGMVGPLGDNDREATFGFLLQYNRFWRETGGTYLSLTPDTGEVILMRDMTLMNLDGARLDDTVGQFIHVIASLRGMLRIGTMSTGATVNTATTAQPAQGDEHLMRI